MVPKYAGKLMDRLVLIVAKQTANVKGNPEEMEYAEARGAALVQVTWSLWRARNKLQRRLKRQKSDATS